MKTAGDLLREKRLQYELTLEAVAAKIKVKPEYLAAIESSQFDLLPRSTFAKGFIRNYARALHVNPETTLAMFRRDFVENEKGEIIPRGLVEPVGNKARLIPVNFILIGIAIVAFVGFLGYELFQWWSLPALTVTEPVSGETYGSLVTVRGSTNPDSVISVNNQKIIVSPDGQFTLDLNFTPGTQSVFVSATNRLGKTRLLERAFMVSK